MKQLLKAITTKEQRNKIAHGLHRLKQTLQGQPSGSSGAVRKKTLKDFEQPYRLHLGCGNIHINGFCNVDVMQTQGVDIIDDIRKLQSFADGTVQEIYACHVLEHFGHDEIVPILSRWHQVLIPGGSLRISVPDMDRIVQIYSKNTEHFKKPGHTPWIGLIYGGQSTPYDYHKTGFNFTWLKYLLEQCGFADCREYPHTPHFVPGVVDASMAHEPFGEYFSLNMLATKPLAKPAAC